MKNVFDFRAKSVNYSGEKLSASEIFRIRSILIVFLADSKGGVLVISESGCSPECVCVCQCKRVKQTWVCLCPCVCVLTAKAIKPADGSAYHTEVTAHVRTTEEMPP